MLKQFNVTVEMPAFVAGKAVDFSTGKDSPLYAVGFMGLSSETSKVFVPATTLRDAIVALRVQEIPLAQKLAEDYQAILNTQLA